MTMNMQEADAFMDFVEWRLRVAIERHFENIPHLVCLDLQMELIDVCNELRDEAKSKIILDCLDYQP